MGNFGSKTQTSKNKVQFPGYLEKAYKGLVGMGQDVASQPLKQYGGPRVEGFSPDQQAAFGATESAQGMGVPYVNAAAGSYDTAGSTFGGALGGLADAYQGVFPQVEKYDANTLAKYMDPYQQYVIDSTMENVQHQNAVQQQQLRSQGLGAGLSPNLGDRAGLAQAELARGQGANTNQTLAQLLSSGFGNAQTALQGQQQLQFQGLTADQQRKLEAAQAAAGIGGQQMQLGTAQAGLGQTAQNMTYQGIQQLLANGLQQQGLGQLQLDQAYDQFNQQQQYPKEQTDWLANLIYGSPGKGATTSTQQTPGPSIFSQLVGLGTAGLGLATRAEGGRVVPHFDAGGTPLVDIGSFVFPEETGWGALGATDPGSTTAYWNPLEQLPRSSWGTPIVYRGPRDWRHDVRHFAVPGGGNGGGNGGGGGSSWNPAGHQGVGSGSNSLAFKRGGVPHFDIGGAADFDPGRFDDAFPQAPAQPPVAWGDTTQPDVVAPSSYAPDAGTAGAGIGAVYPDPSDVPHRKPRVWDTLKGMPLVEMGLGMMGSSSPFPLQAIGEGGLKGLNTALDLDAHPEVDDSGPTVRIWYPSEHRWEDTHLPSSRYSRAGGENFALTPTQFVVKKTGEIINGQYSDRGALRLPTNPETRRPYTEGEVQVYTPGDKAADVAGSRTTAADAAKWNTGGRQHALAMLGTIQEQSRNASAAIDRVVPLVGGMTTGVGGALTDWIPGSPAYDLVQSLVVPNSNAIISTVEALRAMSPSGASGFGQISNFEDQIFASMRAVLNPRMSREAVLQQLDIAKQGFAQIMANAQAGFNYNDQTLSGASRYGGEALPPGAPNPTVAPPALSPAPAPAADDPLGLRRAPAP